MSTIYGYKYFKLRANIKSQPFFFTLNAGKNADPSDFNADPDHLPFFADPDPAPRLIYWNLRTLFFRLSTATF